MVPLRIKPYGKKIFFLKIIQTMAQGPIFPQDIASERVTVMKDDSSKLKCILIWKTEPNNLEKKV